MFKISLVLFQLPHNSLGQLCSVVQLPPAARCPEAAVLEEAHDDELEELENGEKRCSQE